MRVKTAVKLERNETIDKPQTFIVAAADDKIPPLSTG